MKNTLFAIAATLALPVAAAPEPSAGVELTIRDHVHGNAPFVPPGDAFSAAVFMKPEAAVGPENRERLVMSSGNGYYHGFRLCLRPDVRRGTYHPFGAPGRLMRRPAP